MTPMPTILSPFTGAGRCSATVRPFPHIANHSRRHPCHDSVVGYVLGDYGSGADHGSLADRNTAHDGAVAAQGSLRLDPRPDYLPVGFGLQAPIRVDGTGIEVVDKHHPMTHEYPLFDGHPGADKSVAGNLAIGANGSIVLDFHKRANLGPLADGASVKVHQIGLEDLNTTPKNNIR